MGREGHISVWQYVDTSCSDIWASTDVPSFACTSFPLSRTKAHTRMHYCIYKPAVLIQRMCTPSLDFHTCCSRVQTKKYHRKYRNVYSRGLDQTHTAGAHSEIQQCPCHCKKWISRVVLMTQIQNICRKKRVVLTCFEWFQILWGFWLAITDWQGDTAS